MNMGRLSAKRWKEQELARKKVTLRPNTNWHLTITWGSSCRRITKRRSNGIERPQNRGCGMLSATSAYVTWRVKGNTKITKKVLNGSVRRRNRIAQRRKFPLATAAPKGEGCHWIFTKL